MNGDLARVFDFIVEVDRLKAVRRRTKPAGLDRYENSAEHSWQVSLLAILLHDRAREPIDIHRVVEMLLVHDIPEIDAGDQLVYAGPSEARSSAERDAAQRLFGLLPAREATWCLERWQEFEARESKEARFAYAMDRLMPLLQNLRSGGQSWRENRIAPDRVLAVNAAIGDACPSVWDHARELVDDAIRSGVFDFG